MGGGRAVIDLNCDLGESFGAWRLGDDEAMLDLVSSASIACGFHAGDATTMRATVAAAAARAVRIGAHVGYRDLQGFGRRELACTAKEIEDDTLYQLGALTGVCAAEGATVSYVKPHGALYHRCCDDPEAAAAVARATSSVGAGSALMGPAGSCLLDAARAVGLRAEAEAFADRAYEVSGTLVPRGQPGAVLAPPAAAAQALTIATRRVTKTTDGREVAVEADTICLHGDSPGAVEMARAVRAALESEGIVIGVPPR